MQVRPTEKIQLKKRIRLEFICLFILTHNFPEETIKPSHNELFLLTGMICEATV